MSSAGPSLLVTFPGKTKKACLCAALKHPTGEMNQFQCASLPITLWRVMSGMLWHDEEARPKLLVAVPEPRLGRDGGVVREGAYVPTKRMSQLRSLTTIRFNLVATSAGG
jgi:hypothetical protein